MAREWKPKSLPDETCAGCGSVYSVTMTELPARDSDTAKCVECGKVLREWSGTCSYSYTIKTRKPHA